MNNNHNLKIHITSANNSDIWEECEKIAQENNVINGGALIYADLYVYSNYILYCTVNDKLVGYIYLTKDVIVNNDIYIMQIAINKAMQGLGIGSIMVDYLKRHSRQFSCITSNVRPDNKKSYIFHKKNGFKIVGENQHGLIFVKKTKKIFNKKLDIEKDR